MAQVGGDADEPFMSEIGTLSDDVMWLELVIVFAPILNFLPCVVKVHEPMDVQALRPKLAVKTLGEAVLHRLAWSGNAEYHTLVTGPHIEVARDEFTSVVDTNYGRVANGAACAFQGVDKVFPLVAEPCINHRREAGEGINDRQYPDFTAGSQLVRHKIYGP